MASEFFAMQVERDPVLSLVLDSGDVERDEDVLGDTYHNSGARVLAHMDPLSITQFYHHYIETLVNRSINPIERLHHVESRQELVHKVTHKLGSCASRNLLDSTELTERDIGELQGSLSELKNITSSQHHTWWRNNMRWMYESLAGLKSWLTEIQEENENNSSSDAANSLQYKFIEPGVQKYLVALNLANSVADAWNSEWLPSHTRQLNFFFRRTALGQARFWEMWGLLFGALANAGNKDLFAELLEIAHGVIGKVDVSQSEICVTFASIVYECKNKHGLSSNYSDDYLPNQAIKIDGKKIKFFEPYCLSYLMLVVGYLLEVTRFVHSLTLNNLGITARHLRYLVCAASVPHTLQVLDLSHNPLDREGFRSLQVFLVKASSLTHLNLTNCELELSAMLALTQVIECMPLVSLNLSRNNIGDQGAVVLVDKWRNCYCLSDVDLSCNNITDTGAVVIGKYLKKLLSLRSLRLLGNEIIQDGIYSIFRGMDSLSDTTVPCGHLPREDTSREFNCSVYLEACTIQRKRKYDRPQTNMKLRVPKAESPEDATLRNEPPNETDTYIGYDTVDGGDITSEETVLNPDTGRDRKPRGLSDLCRHESLLVTSTPMRTPTKTGMRVASILDSQPRTPVRRRWSTLPADLSANTGSTPGWNRTAPLDRSATIGGLDRSATIGGLDRSATFNGIYRSTISGFDWRFDTLERTPSRRKVIGRRPSQIRKQWDRERRLRKIMSKPLLDRSTMDTTTTHAHSTVSFLED